MDSSVGVDGETEERKGTLGDFGWTVRFYRWTRRLRARNTVARAWLTHNFKCAGAKTLAQSQVIGQFRMRRRYFSCVLCFRDPIAFVFVFFEESLHGQ